MFTVDREEVNFILIRCCRDRPRGGTRNLRQRDCHLAFVSIPTVRRRACDSSHSGEAREEAVLLLPPLSGPTQVGTTPRVLFHVAIRDAECAQLSVSLDMRGDEGRVSQSWLLRIFLARSPLSLW